MQTILVIAGVVAALATAAPAVAGLYTFSGSGFSGGGSYSGLFEATDLNKDGWISLGEISSPFTFSGCLTGNSNVPGFCTEAYTEGGLGSFLYDMDGLLGKRRQRDSLGLCNRHHLSSCLY